MVRDELAERRVLVVGLGKTGLSCARYLAARGCKVTVTDSRAEPPGLAALRAELPGVALALGDFAAPAFARAELLVVSPGVPLSEPQVAAAIARGVEAVGDVELFARAARAPVVAITGSNGKSTVTTLVGEMARHAGIDVRVGGNLGTPALELLGDEEPQLYVLELSSFQLETTASLRAAAAVVLNLSPDHLDRYAGMADYAAAKGRIYHGAERCLVNADDPAAAALAAGCGETVSFGIAAEPADYHLLEGDGGTWLAHRGEPLLAVAGMKLAGRHNFANALAAFALGEAVGLPRPAMLAALRDFPSLPHRCRWLAERDGVRWYDDSKGTNVGATLAAIHGFDTPVVLIAGGLGKGQDFTPLREACAAKARAVVLIGADAGRIEAALDGVVPVARAADMAAAVAAAAGLARPGDSVLLSPACASFDMFRGYEHRGQVFAEEIGRLAR